MSQRCTYLSAAPLESSVCGECVNGGIALLRGPRHRELLGSRLDLTKHSNSSCDQTGDRPWTMAAAAQGQY